MNKHIERIKKQVLDEAMKGGLVILGAVGGTLAIKGIRKFTEDKPSIDAFAEYALPILFAGGGIVISAVTEPNSKLKYFGYGLTVAGGMELLKTNSSAKDALSGFGDTEIPAASAFYTESEERQNIMSGFGLSALPVGNVTMQDAAQFDTRLPELEGADDTGGEDLGFNPSATSETDLNGLL